MSLAEPNSRAGDAGRLLATSAVLAAIAVANAALAWKLGISARATSFGFDPQFFLRWISSLAQAGLIALSALGAGHILTRAFTLPALGRAASLAIRLFGGMGLLAVPLAILHSVLPNGNVGATILHFPLAAVGAFHFFQVFRARSGSGCDFGPTPLPALLLTLVLVAIALVSALTSPHQSDGLRYHLVAAQEWHYRGFMAYIPNNSFLNLPNLLGLLSASAWPRAEVHPLLHFSTLLATIVLAGELASLCVRATHPELVRSAVWNARLLVAAIPSVTIVGAWPFADLAGVAGIIGALVVGFASLEQRSRSMHAAAWMGLLAGASCAAKLSGGPTAVIACFVVLAWWVRLEGPRRAQLVIALPWAVAFTLPLLPFFVRNLVNVGNPLYFPVAGLAGGADWSADCMSLYAEKVAEKGFGHSLTAFLLSPFNVAFHFEKFETQTPGFAFIPTVLIAAAFAIRKRASAMPWVPLFVFCVLGWIAWFAGYQSVRFLLVVLVVLAAAAGAAWTRISSEPSAGVLERVLPLLLAAPGAIWIGQWSLVSSAWPPLKTAFAPPDRVLAYGFNAHPVVTALNAEIARNSGSNAPRQTRAIYIGEHRAAYAATFEPVSSDWFDTPRILLEIRATKTNAELLERWRAEDITYALVNIAELEQYVVLYFKPRFTDAEWKRFESLLSEDLGPRRIIGDNKIFVAKLALQPRLSPLPGSPAVSAINR